MVTGAKTMSKGLVILILILAAAAVVFYFGWIQIRLPADSVAVVFTKTGGYEEKVIRPGAFSWRWQRLLPTNLTLYRYPLRPYAAELTVEELLPSAAMYARVLPETPDFSFRANVWVRFILRPESLPQLLRDEKLTPDALPDYYRLASDALSRAIAERARRGELAGELGTGSGQIAITLREEMEREFPRLQILELQVRDLRLPDPQLYALARDSYRSLVEARDRARNTAAAGLAGEREQEASKLESLAAYGELLNKYPVLLKAIYVQHLTGKELVAIPGFDLDKALSGLESKAP
jgi:hypothetical protein